MADRKRAMRSKALANRAGLATAQRDAGLVASILHHVQMPPGSVVACAWPLPGEPDLRPLLAILHERGCVVALPETPPRGQALLFRRWAPGCVMLAGRFGTFHPDTGEVAPGIVLVPLLAFDAAGYRLGYGGGYYDRTLAGLPGRLAVGFGYAAQQVDRVPVGPHDMALDMVVTERGVARPERSG